MVVWGLDISAFFVHILRLFLLPAKFNINEWREVVNVRSRYTSLRSTVGTLGVIKTYLADEILYSTLTLKSKLSSSFNTYTTHANYRTDRFLTNPSAQRLARSSIESAYWSLVRNALAWCWLRPLAVGRFLGNYFSTGKDHIWCNMMVLSSHCSPIIFHFEKDRPYRTVCMLKGNVRFEKRLATSDVQLGKKTG